MAMSSILFRCGCARNGQAEWDHLERAAADEEFGTLSRWIQEQEFFLERFMGTYCLEITISDVRSIPSLLLRIPDRLIA
jgi:hypothetical protein